MSNHITIHGRLGKDPALEYTQSKLAVTEFSVCCTYGKDDKKTDTWFDVKCFGQLAEHVAATLAKGDTVIVSGRMEAREYTKKDGSKAKFTSLVADEVGASLRWNAWVKDQTEKVVAKTGKVGRPMPKPLPVEEEPF